MGIVSRVPSRERPPRKNQTPNERIISIAMAEEKITGDPRDYVLIAGGDIVSSFGRYGAKSNSTGENVDPSNVEGDGQIEEGRRKVVHRRDLWRYLGKAARRFWKCGRRTRT